MLYHKNSSLIFKLTLEISYKNVKFVCYISRVESVLNF